MRVNMNISYLHRPQDLSERLSRLHSSVIIIVNNPIDIIHELIVFDLSRFTTQQRLYIIINIHSFQKGIVTDLQHLVANPLRRDYALKE